ncbi:hypothetical protein [Paenibacillus sp. UASWS1643]|uniref:hypothetical protein n=1 Tax=Paenibacillus sp. UASWS1643 TaxID=2580422 RepID=UPI001239A286|nr:hypothetical protein [Paenibacillus sp. UASWS1643]KAA8756529.1 hypothetical protein FE296_03545 [Paenibacillus sp. UASWS1643]
MNEEIMLLTYEYVGRDIENMLSILDTSASEQEIEETLRYGAECATKKLETAGLSTEENRGIVTEGIIALVQALHKGSC